MFNKIKNILTKFKIGSAFRASRPIAGAATGVFFALYGVFNVPLSKWFGRTAAMGTALLSFGFFASKLKDEGKIRTIDSEFKQDDQIIFQASVKAILDKLNSNRNKTRAFLNHLDIQTADVLFLMNNANHEIIGDENKVISVLNEIYTATQYQFSKYFLSFLLALTQFGSHYAECTIAITSDNLKSVNYDKVSENILLIFITLLALFNSYQTYKETKTAYEKPSISTLRTAIFTAFNHFQLPVEQEIREIKEIKRMNVNNDPPVTRIEILSQPS